MAEWMKMIDRLGPQKVAVSTINGTIFNRDGLDVNALLKDRQTSGDQAVSHYKDAKHMKPDELYGLPVDVLIPGARPHRITSNNVDTIKAKVISSIANVPITDEAEEILFKKGVLSVPDFISNAGGVILGVVDVLGGKSDDVFKAVNNYIGPISTQILNESRHWATSLIRLSVLEIAECARDSRRKSVCHYR